MVKLGIIGCGNIGRFVMHNLSRDDFAEFSLRAISDVPAMESTLKELASRYECRYSTDPLSLVDSSVDLVLEAASTAAVKVYALPILRSGIDMVAMSVGAFADADFYAAARRAAEDGKSTLLLPTGGIAGLDHLKTARLGGLDDAILIMTKPPKSLVGAPYFDEHPMDLYAIKEPTVVFEDVAAEAIKGFPQNVNVAVALSLATLGPDQTRFRLVCDPAATTVKIEIYARGPTTELKLQVVNFPSPDNPRTSTQACLGAMQALKRFSDRVHIGT